MFMFAVKVGQLVEMGFTKEQAQVMLCQHTTYNAQRGQRALDSSNQSVELATDKLIQDPHQ
jgi:hypothetical protein